jgi:hypothetical protein
MASRLHIFAGFYAAALALAVVGVVWALLQEPCVQRQRLPDGTVLLLKAVTYGKQARFVEGAWWQRLLPSLPPELERFGARVHPGIGFEGMHLWTRTRGAPALNDPSLHSLDWMTEYTAFDEHGCRFAPPENGSGLWDADQSTAARADDLLLETTLKTFPRRGRTVGVGLYDATGRQWIVRFDVPNPTPGPYPVWKGELLPVIRHSGRLTCLLTGFARKELNDGPRWGATVQVTEDGKRTRDWEPVTLTVSDATGNSLYAIVSGYRDQGKAWFRPLCTHEAAWKLRVEFAPTFPVHRAPNFLWIVRNIRVPKPREYAESKAQATRQGIRLELEGVGGVGEKSWSFWVLRDTVSRKLPWAWVSMPSLKESVRLTLVRVTDARRGDRAPREYSPSNLFGFRSDICRPDTANCALNVRIPPGAKRIDLTFAVHRTRAVEFLVKPPFPTQR